MHLEKSYIINYRNLKEVVLDLHPNLNFFIGQNGQGKTNFLETIYILGTGTSHRTNIDKELVNWDENKAIIQGKLHRQDQELKMEFQLKGTKKSAMINNYPIQKITEFIGNLNVVLFSPEDLSLVKGGPNKRRRFLDIEISQISSFYLHLLRTYNHILKQRNNLLKKIKYNEGDEIMLDIWNTQLIDVGSKIIHKRVQTIEKMKKLARKVQEEITLEKEYLSLEYDNSFKIKKLEEASLEEIQEAFKNILKYNKSKEIERGYSLYGPHRDDLIFKFNEIDARKYGSQGQQRTIALALKLAEIKFMEQQTGETPILLLDDVFSELDESRRNALIKIISNRIQTFITSTELEDFNALRKNSHKVFTVKEGTITNSETYNNSKEKEEI
ncbi:MAG: DNA replication/repair protein RecF [bacterium]